ncbi:hypothetical protein ACS5PK_02495 [Roseateles sp. DB2]|uniref:hypothetical protein n=1 Tax=Roseateles sp. DB2 TaxID=3453717 RepID=UPI003EE95BB6
MKIKSRLAAIAAMSLLSACANFSTASNFVRAEASGIEGSKTVVVLIGPNEPPIKVMDTFKTYAPGTDLSWLPGDKACGLQQVPPTPAIAAPLVPIIAAVAEVAFNLWADEQQRKIEANVESAKASYAATWIMSADQLAQTQCVAMVRYTQDDGGPIKSGLTTVLKFNHLGPAPDGLSRSFTFTPIYVHMTNSVAVTMKAPEPKTSLSFAVSVKAVGTPEGGVQRLLPSGEGVTTVPAVKLGKAPRCSTSDCKTSDLMPYPVKAGALSVTMAIAEQGNTGFDDKAALAELAAVKAALGPAIGEAVKKKFGD